MILSARDVQIAEDEYEVGMTFVWAHPTRDWDCLSFERPWPPVVTSHGTSPVWVSRRAQFHSGCPGIERFELHRNMAHVVFMEDLANKLQMECQVSIGFGLDDQGFDDARRTLSRVFEGCAWYSDEGERRLR